jgi:hypothetical protein
MPFKDIPAFQIALFKLGEEPLTEERLEEIISDLKKIYSEEVLLDTRRRLESQIGVTVTKGVGVKDSHQEPWLEQRKIDDEQWIYWETYKKWIRECGFSSDVVRVLDEDTDAILGLCGDPKRGGDWRIKGLVMGDVQSGKTANYAGLINKAADTGYKVIILLTGVIEALRSQTQSRLDEGFVGEDSQKRFMNRESAIGVGIQRFMRKRTPGVLTTVESDFRTANLAAIGGLQLETLVSAEPVLLVLKKNKGVLESLLEYLNKQKRDNVSKMDFPALIIDDEADNASVNVRGVDNPATINKLITQIKDTFSRSTYCAYTATPFANVFIDPDNERDLFPENFVYTLHSPTSYVGAASIFLEDGEHNHQLVSIDDAEQYFPDKHKKELVIDGLPESLKEAVRSFLIVSTIRDIRGERLKHRSMLINVSRFTSVQENLSDVVKAYLYDVKEQVREFIGLPQSKHIAYQHLRQLHDTFTRLHYSCGVTWEQISDEMHRSIKMMKVITVNQNSQNTERLDYKNAESLTMGQRVIAIGGMTLSRGLTLEGLSTSYFYRNSKAYDTLLQMGRWFGYRVGYSDLCKIWMSEEVQDWYAHLAEVVDDLRQDIKVMHAHNRKPIDFGLRVRSHPGALLVTARNKMKESKEVVVQVSYSKFKTETPYIIRNPSSQERNLRATISFVERLGTPTEQKGRRLWKDCSKSDVALFLSELEISSQNTAFLAASDNGEQPLIKFISETDLPCMQTWDVALPSGGEKPIDSIMIKDRFGIQQSFSPRGRQFEKVTAASSYLKINRGRVGEIEDETIGMDDSLIQSIREEWLSDKSNNGKKTVPGKAFLEKRSRPLITISLIVPRLPSLPVGEVLSKRPAREIMDPQAVGAGPFVAISLSFPSFSEDEMASSDTFVSYRLNLVALRELGLVEEEDSDAND